MKSMWLLTLSIFLLAACAPPESAETAPEELFEELEVATFAGGCFWCTESDFEKQEGVVEVISGYTGGSIENPTYKQVSSGTTGHTEAIQVFYDPTQTNYEELLNVLWRHMDPTDPNGQFVDRGKQYRSGIFYHSEEQKQLAEQSKHALAASGIFDKPIVTEITEFTIFYPAEEYHQDYHTKNPLRYTFYRHNSGRDQFLEKVWGTEEISSKPSVEKTTSSVKTYQKPSDEELKKKLTPLQYEITQNEGTERPFDNEYWDNKEEGIYVDVVSGEPLFSSKDKYKSGTGWPSFTKPLEEENLVTKKDFKLVYPRTELRSKNADSHLGHLFNDGPEPTGERYCINSAALDFIPKDQLEEKGYGEYMDLFQ